MFLLAVGCSRCSQFLHPRTTPDLNLTPFRRLVPRNSAQILFSLGITRLFKTLLTSKRGRLVKDRTTKEPKLNLRNWECGVIFPVRAGDVDAGNLNRDQGPPGMEVFKDKIPVPMIVPGEEYAGRKPWFYTKER